MTLHFPFAEPCSDSEPGKFCVVLSDQCIRGCFFPTRCAI